VVVILVVSLFSFLLIASGGLYWYNNVSTTETSGTSTSGTGTTKTTSGTGTPSTTSLTSPCVSAGGALVNGVCQFSGSVCPSGWNTVENWTETQPVTGSGGSTSGCNDGKQCTTGSHGWANVPIETCSAATYMLCGPMTKGEKIISAKVTKIGCKQ